MTVKISVQMELPDNIDDNTREDMILGLQDHIINFEADLRANADSKVKREFESSTGEEFTINITTERE